MAPMHRIYRRVLPFFRRRRAAQFNRLIRPEGVWTILDVGGFHWFWQEIGFQGPITCMNLEPVAPLGRPAANIRQIQGDGRAMAFGDGAFDLVFSNSVIEHQGTFADQRRFADEVRRVGRGYWVQTPNKRFWLEPHLIAPLVHFLPKMIQRRLLRWVTVWGLVTKPDQRRIDAFLAEVRLLDAAELRQLFPDATIVAERFFGFRKSLIAYRRPPVP